MKLMLKFQSAELFNPYHATDLFLHHLKTSENLRFSNVFRGIDETSSMKWLHLPLFAYPI